MRIVYSTGVLFSHYYSVNVVSKKVNWRCAALRCAEPNRIELGLTHTSSYANVSPSPARIVIQLIMSIWLLIHVLDHWTREFTSVFSRIRRIGGSMQCHHGSARLGSLMWMPFWSRPQIPVLCCTYKYKHISRLTYIHYTTVYGI